MKKPHYCIRPGCGKPVEKKGYCSPECKKIAEAPWVVRGGVGGTMYCGSAGGTWPFCWKIRRDHARQWPFKEHAEQVALLVEGVVEQVFD